MRELTLIYNMPYTTFPVPPCFRAREYSLGRISTVASGSALLGNIVNYYTVAEYAAK